MSYILDALKRSDRERKQGLTPSIHSMHGNYFEHRFPQRRSQFRSKIVVSTSLLLVAGVFFSTLMMRSNSEENRSPIATHNSPAHVETPKIVTDSPLPPISQEKPADVTSLTVIERPPVITRDKEKKVLRPMRDKLILSSTEISSPDATQTKKQSPILLEDLPPSVRIRIPEFHFAGHTYAENPAQRMIIINNKILREGYRVDSETQLLEITWNGVIIEFEEHQIMIRTE